MRIAIIIHVYYKELWPELLQCVRAFEFARPELFVTISDSIEFFQKQICADIPSATVQIVENRGYDIWPFLLVLRKIHIEEYDYILKLHTKRDCTEWVNYWHFAKGAWRHSLLAPFSTKRAARRTLQFLETHKNVGMAGRSSLIIGEGDYLESEGIRCEADQIVTSLGLMPSKRIFVAGTVFLSRAACMAPFQQIPASTLFELSSGGEMNGNIHKSGLAHAYERALGYAVAAQGYSIADSSRLAVFQPLSFGLRKFFFIVMRFVYRKTIKRTPVSRPQSPDLSACPASAMLRPRRSTRKSALRDSSSPNVTKPAQQGRNLSDGTLVSRAISLEQYAKPAVERRGGSLERCGPT